MQITTEIAEQQRHTFIYLRQMEKKKEERKESKDVQRHLWRIARVNLICYSCVESFIVKFLVSSIENDSRYKRTWGKGNSKGSNVVSRQPSGVRNGQTAQTNAAAAPSGPYINRVTNDAREDEMEDNLQAVGGIIGNMKDMALNMGNEIDKQNVQIDRINDKVSLRPITANEKYFQKMAFTSILPSGS
uniref:Synaptosomal-associated protein n=1 Tax=Poecilia mexicana TaxID=48701 RepID=A0A3B3X0G0_9TELE